jgi:hypothetical protein
MSSTCPCQGFSLYTEAASAPTQSSTLYRYGTQDEHFSLPSALQVYRSTTCSSARYTGAAPASTRSSPRYTGAATALAPAPAQGFRRREAASAYNQNSSSYREKQQPTLRCCLFPIPLPAEGCMDWTLPFGFALVSLQIKLLL